MSLTCEKLLAAGWRSARRTSTTKITSMDLLDEIIAISTIKYPPQALDEEIGIVMDLIENDLKREQPGLSHLLKGPPDG